MRDGKKTPRHTESTFSDTALKTSGSINLKIQVFPLLWKGGLIPALRYPETVSTSVHNDLSFHQPYFSLNQTISIISMCLIHRILAAWRKHICFCYNVASGLVPGVETRKVNPAFGAFPLFHDLPAPSVLVLS